MEQISNFNLFDILQGWGPHLGIYILWREHKLLGREQKLLWREQKRHGKEARRRLKRVERGIDSLLKERSK